MKCEKIFTKRLENCTLFSNFPREHAAQLILIAKGTVVISLFKYRTKVTAS